MASREAPQSSIFMVWRQSPGAVSTMDRRELRRQCEALVGELEIPNPFDLSDFCVQLGRRRSRQIRQLEMALPAGGPCGLLVSTDEADIVVFERYTSAWHQRHIMLHELGHVLWGHVKEIAPATSTMLLPHLDPAMVRRMLARTSYSELEERQAEMVASLILARVSRWAPETTWRPSPDDALLRVEVSLHGHSGVLTHSLRDDVE